METIYLSLREQVAGSTFFMKSPVSSRQADQNYYKGKQSTRNQVYNYFHNHWIFKNP